VKRVFVDSGGFFGLLIREDGHHACARELFAQAKTEGWGLVTTNVVVIETYALLLNRSLQGRVLAVRFLDWLDRVESIQRERITEDDEDKAVALVRDHDDKTYSLCDALSFTVMERLGVREAIAFDRDFRSYGRFTIL
jgi:predicted nucleic acid-binding protein